MSLARRELAIALLLSLTACSGPAHTPHPSPGPMPPNAAWHGVYQGPYHIALNIWTRGNRASGNWRAVGDREGEFSGTVFGNLLVLNWNEQGLKNAERHSGRGYFVYGLGKPGEPDQIYGEWGVGRTGRTSPWWAVKRGNEPLGKNGLLDKTADDPNQGDVPGCEMGNCDEDFENQ